MTPQRARNIRKRKFAFQEGRCYLCGEPMSMDVPPNDPMFATFDHIIPLHDGGRRSSRANIKLAHRSCNMKRGRETGMRRKAEVTREILRSRGLDVENGT